MPSLIMISAIPPAPMLLTASFHKASFSAMVFTGMLRLICNNQIARIVIAFVSVQMVNVFSMEQIPSQNLLHNQPVLQYISSSHGRMVLAMDFNVSRIFNSTPLPTWVKFWVNGHLSPPARSASWGFGIKNIGNMLTAFTAIFDSCGRFWHLESMGWNLNNAINK